MENEIDSLHLQEFLPTGVKEKAGTSFAAAGSKFDLVQNNNASRRQKVNSR